MKSLPKFKLATLLPIVAMALTACATTSYNVDNQTYKNRDEAWAASMRRDAEAEAAISSSTTPLVDRKLLVVIPTPGALLNTVAAQKQNQGKLSAPGTAARAADDFRADSIVANLKSVGLSLRKANIYREVEIMDVDSTTTNIQPSQSQDVFTFYLGTDGGMAVFYFLSAKSGKQVVAEDMGQARIGDRRKSLVDDVKAKALQ